MPSPKTKEISCRITRTLLMYVREKMEGSLAGILNGLELDEEYLSDTNNWISHAFLQVLYDRMIKILGDENAVYNMTLASGRFQSLGILDRIARLLGNPKLIYSHAPKYNRLLKKNGDVTIHEMGDSWVLLEDRYHDSAQKTRYDCDYTRGILAGIPTMFNLPVAKVEEIECQVAPEKYGRRRWDDRPPQGCRGCLYRVEWNSRGFVPLWRRLFTRHSLYSRAIEDLLDANQRIQEKYDEASRLASSLAEANRQLLESKKKLEEGAVQLSASEQRYRLLAENVSDIIWRLNLATMKFEYVSPSVKRVRGFSPEEAMARDLQETLSPQSMELVAGVLQEELGRDNRYGIDPNRSRTLEIQHLLSDGSYAWSEATMTFIRDQEGRPKGILGVSRDITERRQAEKEAGELTAQLNRAQKMEAVGNLAASVAHDLNNILSGLVSYPELLLMDLPEDSPLRGSINSIMQSGRRAAAVVQDLLTLTRRGVGINDVINLNDVVEEYEASPEHRQLKQDHPNVSFDFELSDNLINVKGSPVHLSKMIMNLAANAAEAMPAGGTIFIRTENVYLDTPKKGYELIPEGEYVVLCVRDEGFGISEDDLKKIFEPFYTKKSMGRSGTGLGMTVIWSTVKDFQGYMDVTSREGQGTEFQIHLPATREEINEMDKQLVIDDYLGSESILVVDDIEEQRELATQMLGKLGYSVTALSSGEAAVDYLKDKRVDLIVLDMIMDPGIDGLETYRRIMDFHPGQKAIIASGFSESDRVRELQSLGAGTYVQKPYTLEKIGIAVRRELDRG